MADRLEEEIAAHYHRPELLDAIIEGLKRSGADPDAPTLEDLAPVDEFHTAGRETTLMALDDSGIEAGMRVLDAGCGIGGTARHLAQERGCRVTGIDLTSGYVEVARELTRRTGLEDDCQFHVGSVIDMPFADDSFEAAVSFHVAMNIHDRTQFYAELYRVLQRDARLRVFDVMKGPTAGMRYPVPWSETGADSFLRSSEETCQLLRQGGFDIVSETSLRRFAMDFFRGVFAKAATQDGPPPIGLHLLTGTNAPEKFKNYAEALNDHQIDPVVIIAERQ
ncbi:MAG: methyltransferase domain-containing protein [Hyphomicrobiales bacterium]|nr:methyltransferase domain-containing protein [Hyphomicrobiales bacterium]MCP4997778.1 methyltransferase domain-containing protein [Hyphomicrobiales bacterium]